MKLFLLGLMASLPVACQTFSSNVSPILPAVERAMTGRSWHAGCPVAIKDLASISVSYWGFDQKAHQGTLVIHRELAADTVAIFGELFAARIPIERMKPYEDYAIGAYAADNDTAGFYCRPAQDNPSELSMHSYGFAIDINPLRNPYLDPKQGWWPRGSEAFHERSEADASRITTKSEAFEIFTRHGWGWGGLWDPPDYMHFYKATAGGDPNPLKNPYVVRSLELRK